MDTLHVRQSKKSRIWLIQPRIMETLGSINNMMMFTNNCSDHLYQYQYFHYECELNDELSLVA